jgi:hypothetical protein
MQPQEEGMLPSRAIEWNRTMFYTDIFSAVKLLPSLLN